MSVEEKVWSSGLDGREELVVFFFVLIWLLFDVLSGVWGLAVTADLTVFKNIKLPPKIYPIKFNKLT